MKEKKFIKLTPFKMQVLQSFPFIDADFDAITNYELLCKVVEYLNKTVDNVNLLESDFKELYDYVHDYFDNLDVQEEINNKLDDMAESGELADIIAQYLRLAGVLAYNTINEMKNAENLTNGSICKCLGKNTYNDGNGSYYKIRNVTNDDIIDNINIISLNNSNTLIAEKIKDINTKPIKPITLGTFHKSFSETNKKSYLFLSTDNYNFTKIPNIELNGYDNNVFSDPFITWDKFNKQFIITTDDQSDDRTCVIVTTKDLINYTYHVIKLNYPITIGKNRFGPELFWYNNELYLVISVNSNNYDVFNWHTMIAKCNDLINMTFDNAFEITFNTNSDLYDPSIIYFNNKFYLTGANQETANIEMYESNSLSNEFTQINSNLLQIAGGNNTCEGGAFSIINGKLNVISEMQNDEIMICCEMTTPGIVDKQRIIKSLKNYKAGNFIVIDDLNALNIIQQLEFTYNDESDYKLSTSLNEITLTQDTTIPEFTLIPNKILVINGNYNLTITNILDPFNLKKLPIIINSNTTTLTISKYKNDSAFSRSISFKNNQAHNLLRTLYFNYYTTTDFNDEYITRYGNYTIVDGNGKFTMLSHNCWEVNKVKTINIILSATDTACDNVKILNISDNVKPVIDTILPVYNGFNEKVGSAKISNDGISLKINAMTVGYVYIINGVYI